MGTTVVVYTTIAHTSIVCAIEHLVVVIVCSSTCYELPN